MVVLLKWLHLMATVAWIGGMLINFLVYIPAIGRVLEPPVAGRLMGSVMKRFRLLVYVAMGILLLSGSLMGIMHSRAASAVPSGGSYVVLLFLKILIFTIMVLLAIYAFEILAPKVARIAASGPSSKLSRYQKFQKVLAMAGFFLGIIVIAISAAL